MLSMRSQHKIDLSSEDQINRNLLQITAADRAFVIDLTSGKCIHDFCDMTQLLQPEHFIPAHINFQDCYIEGKNKSETLMIEYADVNKAKDFFIMKKKRCKVVHFDGQDEVRSVKKQLEEDD